MTIHVNGYTVHGNNEVEFTPRSRKKHLEAGQDASHARGVILNISGDAGRDRRPRRLSVGMHNIVRRTAVLLVAALLTAPALFAWGHNGHQIVATVAAHGLSAGAAAQVSQLLGGKSLADVASLP